MERLTVSSAITQKDIDKLMELSDENQFGRNAAYYKLQLYEDLEEQGVLLRLPCKVGTHIWVNGVLGCGEAEEYTVIRVDYHSNRGTGRREFYIEALLTSDPTGGSIGFYDKEFGKTVFLTQAEAEAKLEELQNEA